MMASLRPSASTCQAWPRSTSSVLRPGCAGCGARRFRPDAAARTEGSAPPGADGAGVDGEVALIGGPAGAGKSTVGFQLYINCMNGGLSAGYVDLEQIGLVRPAPRDVLQRHRIRARNLAAIWRNYRATGATHLIATGPIEDQAAFQVYAEELPAACIRLCRLRAGFNQLSQRIMSRGAGGSWPQPGDPLRG
jgi:hypothetical protein